MKNLSKAAKKKLGFQGPDEDPSKRPKGDINFNSSKYFVPDYTRDNSSGRTPKSEQRRLVQTLRKRNPVKYYQQEKKKYSYPGEGED